MFSSVSGGFCGARPLDRVKLTFKAAESGPVRQDLLPQLCYFVDEALLLGIGGYRGAGQRLGDADDLFLQPRQLGAVSDRLLEQPIDARAEVRPLGPHLGNQGRLLLQEGGDLSLKPLDLRIARCGLAQRLDPRGEVCLLPIEPGEERRLGLGNRGDLRAVAFRVLAQGLDPCREIGLLAIELGEERRLGLGHRSDLRIQACQLGTIAGSLLQKLVDLWPSSVRQLPLALDGGLGRVPPLLEPAIKGHVAL